MSLPHNWCSASLHELCVPTEQVEPLPEREFIYIDISAVDRLTKRIKTPQRLMGGDAPSRARKLVRTGDTLVSMTRPNLNAVALVTSELDGQIASTGFEVLRAPALDPRWLAYLVRTSSFVDAMSALVQGALYPAVRSKDVRAFTVPVAPRAEQARIADKLDTLLARVDACRDRLARVAPLLKRFRQSVLTAATSGRLTEDWRGLRGLPAPKTVQLGDVIRVSSGKLLTAKDMAVGGTVPVYGGNGINGYHDVGNVDESTIVIGRVGFYCGSVHMTPKLAWVTDNALVVKHDSKTASARFLFYALQAIDLRANDSSTAQPVISGQKIYPLPMVLPDPGEQAEIIRRIETLFAFADRLEARLGQAQTAVDRLTPSLLSKAFRGELVAQDPKDEPASELLRRLHADRPASKSTRRGKAAA
ncbi:restriction endonuclease subunit S [Variovorax atrisoli]|uniref:restriction endonuclease subunit S n=1 Tax=Variovorax atrisoli TaxID=3394203 RepID=UPI003390FFA9